MSIIFEAQNNISFPTIFEAPVSLLERFKPIPGMINNKSKYTNHLLLVNLTHNSPKYLGINLA